MKESRKQRAEAILRRRTQQNFPSREEAIQKIAGEAVLHFYWGVDPTGPDIHLGHVVQLLLLNDLASLGHTITILFGDFTAQIGDPTGKDQSRKALSKEEVLGNSVEYLTQIKQVVPDMAFKVRHNSEWLAKQTMEDVIKLASRLTVQQLLARDMFQERIQNERPIFLNEFLYPLLQGYDSVALQVDGEVGGNDQIFNMLVGRELENELLRKEKLVLATPLLIEGETGKKMSKSEGTLLAVRDTPQEIRRKVLNILSDDAIPQAFRLCTTRSQADIEALELQHRNDARALKELLSDELIRMFHGENSVNASRSPHQSSARVLVEAVLQSGAVETISEAKRLISQGSVEINKAPTQEWKHPLSPGDRVRVGKRFDLIII